ncbi:MAG: tetratricopeptide repeat protein [Candidatus Zixiibacteriota bacterium]|nr:MAG: tetratricopeptide repeat protein [candidate division Zixibacteria bacterium]
MRGHLKNRVFWGILSVFFVAAFASFLYAQNIKPEIEQAIQSGDTTKALTMLDGDISIDPSNPWNYHTKGMIFYNQGKYAAAAEQFRIALDKKSKHFESLYQLGLCELNLGNLDEAEEIMQEGIKKDRSNKHIFEDGYGQVMMARENWQEADRYFRQAIVGDSANPQYHIHLGDANFYQGVPALAIMEYEKALQVDTGSLEVYYHWAEACLEMKDYACAIEKLRVVLTKDSTHAPAWMRAGGIYFKAALSSRNRQDRSDRFKDAIGSYKRYLELSGAQPDSSNVRVFFELAMSFSNLRGYEDAAEYFDKVLAIPVEARDIYYHYGQALWYNRDYEKAAEMLNKHLEWVAGQDETYSSSVDGAEVYQLLGDSYYYRKPKDFAAAIDYYKKSLDINPEQERVLQNLAIAYHSLQSYVQALEYYQRRIDMGIDSASSSILSNAGKCAFSIAYTQDNGDEEDDIDEGLSDIGGGPNPNVNYYELAADYFKQYLDFVPTDMGIVERIASIYLYQLSDCTNGVKYYEQLLSLDPKNCDANKALGHAYFLEDLCTRNYSKALNYFLKAQNCMAATGGECKDPGLVLAIAQAYHLRAVAKNEAKQDASEDFRNANTWYKRCLKCDPGNKDAEEGVSQTEYEF